MGKNKYLRQSMSVMGLLIAPTVMRQHMTLHPTENGTDEIEEHRDAMEEFTSRCEGN